MSITIGRIRVVEIDPPSADAAYEFAVELFVRATPYYMGGEGRLWGNFTRSQMRGVADRLVAERGYTNIQRAEIDAWVDSLPWDAEWEGERYIDLYFQE